MHYDRRFYENQAEKSYFSAKAMLTKLLDYIKPESVVDVGCGVGTWLAAAEELGIQKLKGFDGEWVLSQSLQTEKMDFTPIDFEQDALVVNERYDLCMSLEVAEHVSENRAQAFVAFLCELSDAVLFSAAVEGQGGTNHINEQWQSYWIELFKLNGFHYTLALREQVWEISEINPFYRQNILLFYKPDSKFSAPIASIPHKEIINVVHPQQYANREVYIDAWKNKVLQPGIRFSIDCLQKALRRKVASYFRCT